MFSATVVLSAVGSMTLAFGLASAALQRGLGFFQLGFACLGDGAVDATGQRRGFGHQGAGTAQGSGGGVHVTFLQHDLAAAQVGLGQLPLVLLEGRIVGRFVPASAAN